MARRALRLRARELRQSGMAITQIAQELAIAKSCVSLWVRDIELTPEQVAALHAQKGAYGAQNKGAQSNRMNALRQRKIYQEEGRQRAQQGSRLHYGGCMLYWAEGAKDRNRIQYANTDPHMHRVFIRFLREELLVTEKDFIVHIICHHHERDEQQLIEAYWLSVLQLQPHNLRTTTYKRGSETFHNHLPNGVCNLNVYSTALVQHIYGAIQEYGGFEEPSWLG
jgi:IS30 family transposase